MIKKFVAWVKSLFVPVQIKESSVDEYIAAQERRTHVQPTDVVLTVTVKGDQETARATETLSTVRFVGAEKRGIDEPVKENEVVTGVDIANGTVNVTKVEIKPAERKPATPPKRLNDQLREVELPSYAQGKKLPPKAKRKFIAEAKRPDRRSEDTPSRGAFDSLDPTSAIVYGAGAAAILSSDEAQPSGPAEPPVRVEECTPAPSYTPSYSDSTPSHHSSHDSYSSSSSSYDSGSSYSDSGSSSSSCD